MLLHGLTPSVHDHRKTDLTSEILLPKLLQQLCGDFDAQVKQYFSIEVHQQIEDMINGEDDMKIMDGQNPFLLVFQPLRFLERPTLGTVSILSGFIVKLPFFTFGTSLQNSTHCRRAAIDNRAHSFRLIIRKPMSFFIFTHMFAENLRNIVFHPRLLHCYITYSCARFVQRFALPALGRGRRSRPARKMIRREKLL